MEPFDLRAAARRIMARCDELAAYTSMTGGIERVYLSPEHARVNRVAARWMREVGLDTRQDEAGNLVGHLDGKDPEAPALLLGSHLDTVRDAGRYDGILGVLMAIEVVRALRPRASEMRFGLDVVAFWDEEGARFGTALLGSSAMAGRWNESWWGLTDEHGTTLRTAFSEFGLDPGRIGAAARTRESLAGYLEAHIEQGPELDDGGAPLGVVTSIASARRFAVQIDGEARHAGGARYEKRHDALLGASEVALAVERLCRAEHHIIGTVGRLETFPGAVNIVPGEARLTVDLRGEHDDDRDRVWGSITRELDEIAGRRGLAWSARELHEAPAVMCDDLLQDVVRAGIEATGRRHVPALFSRAGHDAMAIGAVTGVGMLFLRNPDGISHHPDEDVSLADVETGLQALTATVEHLARESA